MLLTHRCLSSSSPGMGSDRLQVLCEISSWDISSAPRLLLFPYLGMRILQKFQCLGPLLQQSDRQGRDQGFVQYVTCVRTLLVCPFPGLRGLVQSLPKAVYYIGTPRSQNSILTLNSQKETGANCLSP